MNTTNLIGGGMFGVGLGWTTLLLAIFFIPLPRAARSFFGVLGIGSALPSFGIGIAVLADGVGPFGLTTDFYALVFIVAQFVGTWGFAVSYLRWFFKNNTLVNTNEAQDTNERIREMQTRGQSDQPLEQTDRTEGHDHRGSIDAKLQADTDARTEERKLDREERAEERREDREERAEEGREDREERADERRDERDERNE